MTTASPTRVPAPPRGHAALRRLVAVDPGRFAREHWGTAPLVSHAADLPCGFGDLFGNDAVDELVAERGLRTPFVRLAREGATLGDRTFTTGGGVGAGIDDQVSDDKVLRLFGEGATIVLQALHRTWAPISDFSKDLAADLGHPVQVNAYVTPPQNTGFGDHYDVHDVFVLQVEGEKRWRVRRPVLPLPLRGQPWHARRDEVARVAREDPLLELTMRPGDCLYLPRGYLHSATALGGVSTHLTIGVHAWTRHHLLEEVLELALARVAEDEAVRASLPLGVDVTDPEDIGADVELARAALVRALDDVDPADLVAALGGRVRAAQRATPVGPLAQLRALADGPDRVRLRRHLAASLVPGADDPPDGGMTLVSRAGRLPLGPTDVPGVRRLLLGEPLPVAELGSDLLDRLVRAGVAVPDPTPSASHRA